MESINLIDFKQILLNDDIKYIRFVTKNPNRLYLIEDYTNIILEELAEQLNKLNTIDDIRNFFINKDPNVNIFEFIPLNEIKQHLDVIRNLNQTDRKKVTVILQESKKLQIKYINFTYFFVETKDGKIYYADYNSKNDEAYLKQLKIIKFVSPADYKKIVKDIKTYQAFKYHDKTIKYEDIKQYIDNPLLKVDNDLKYLIDKIRPDLLKDNLKDEMESVITNVSKNDLNLKHDEEEKVKVDNNLKKDSSQYLNKEDNLLKKSPQKEKGNFKNSFLFYCLIGFSIGVVLAAITIVVVSYI